MAFMTFSDDCKIVDCADYVSASSSRDGIDIDTRGYSGVCLIVKFATIASTAVTSIKAQHGDTTGGGYSDIAGTSQTIADDKDNQIFYIDIKKPQKRYVRLVVSKATAAAAESAVAVLYGAASKPSTNDADVTGEEFVYPAGGTA